MAAAKSSERTVAAFAILLAVDEMPADRLLDLNGMLPHRASLAHQTVVIVNLATVSLESLLGLIDSSVPLVRRCGHRSP